MPENNPNPVIENGAGDTINSGGPTGEIIKPTSFDDFLKQEGNQAEFDRRVQKAINTAVTNAKEKWDAATNEQLSEAEKLAKMTASEKAAYQQSKREKELNEREAAITRKELEATAKTTLADKGISPELSAFLNYSSADDCSRSIEALEKAFNAAVEEKVKKNLEGSSPMRKAPDVPDGKNDLQRQVEQAMAGGFGLTFK